MTKPQISCDFFCENKISNRRNLFKEAISRAKLGRVLYILKEEINELPQLSQDMSTVNRQYLKMISFLYAPTLVILIESISTLPDWENVPSTIILDDLGEYCDKNNKQNACGVVALLTDTAYSCSKHLGRNTKLCISINRDILGYDYCKILVDLYSST